MHSYLLLLQSDSRQGEWRSLRKHMWMRSHFGLTGCDDAQGGSDAEGWGWVCVLGGGAMWGWGWWLGERDERGGESGTRSGKSESYGSHHHLKRLETPEGGSSVPERTRTLSAMSALGFFIFSQHHRLPVRVSNHEPSPNVVQASRRNVDIKLKVGWVPGNVISSTELAHYGWIVVVFLLALIISHSVEALFAARDAGWFLCSWPQGTFDEKRRIYVRCNLILHCAKMTTKKMWFYLL